MSDLYKTQAEWLKTWQEGQEKLIKQYAGWGESLMENVLKSDNKDPNLFMGWFKPQSDFGEQFKEFNQRMSEMVHGAWGGKVPAEMLKFMDISSFGEFYKKWLSSFELPEGIKTPLDMNEGLQQVTDFFRSFMEKNNPYFPSSSHTNIADQMSRVLGMMQGTLGREENFLNDILKGYQDFFSKMFESSTTQSAEKFAEVFDAWAKEMEKQLSAPKMGINRELSHELSQSLVLSQNYIQAYNKLARLVEATGRKAATSFQEKLGEAALKNEPVNKFVDLCALWSVENEAVFTEVMGSEEFAKLQGEFVNAGHRMKIHLNKLGERALEQTPVSLKRDLDLAIAEITQLKRDMRALKRELREKGKEPLVAREAQTAPGEENREQAGGSAESGKAEDTVKAAQEETGKATRPADVVPAETGKVKAAGTIKKPPAKQMKIDGNTVQAVLAAANKPKA